MFESDAYVRLGRDARRVLLELMCLADDDGRVQGSARHLRAQRYAEDDDLMTAQIEGWIAEVEREGWIRRYQVAGNTVAQVIGWSDYGSTTYQVVNRRTPSRFPPPPDDSGSPPPALPPPSPRPPSGLPSGSQHAHVGLSESDVRKPPPLTSGSVRTHVGLTPDSDRAHVSLPSDSVTDQEEEEEEEDLSLSARTHETPTPGSAPPRPPSDGVPRPASPPPPAEPAPPRVSGLVPAPLVVPGVCTEAEFLLLWNALPAVAERIRAVMFLGGTNNANLRRQGKPPEWWREVLDHVPRSPFLRGEVKGFVLTPKWLLADENALEVLTGRYDEAPPPGTARTTSTADGLTPEQLERLTAFCAGWTKGAGTDGHVAPAEPPSARTAERDRVLVPQLDRWAASPATAPWASGTGGEGAAAYLRAQVLGGKRRGVPDLAKLARTPVELEEALRRGEAYRRKPTTSAPAASTSASTSGKAARPERPDETPAQQLARLRVIRDAGMGGEEVKARIAALEAQLGEDRGETTMVLDEEADASRAQLTSLPVRTPSRPHVVVAGRPVR